MPEPVQKRIAALKKLQVASLEIDVEFHNEVLKVEQKLQSKYDEIYKKRMEIVEGSFEPIDECKTEEKDSESNVVGDNRENAGVPDFWCKVLKNVPEIHYLVQDYDEPVLKVRRSLLYF